MHMFDGRSAESELLKVAPTTAMLLFGLAVCIHQRFRRPEVSRYLAVAILLDLLRQAIEHHAGHTVFPRITNNNFANTNLKNVDANQLSNVVYFLLRSVRTVLSTTIWVIAFWTVLYVEDRNEAET
jgi:hypothetical protein